jgi:small-conductance mechanosensitive channel
MRYFLILQLLILHVVFGSAIAQEIQEKPVVVQQVHKEVIPFIAVSDVPERAAKTLLELKDIALVLKDDSEIVQMQDAVPSYIKSVDELLKASNSKNLKKESIRNLEKMYAEWSIYLKQLFTWEEELKARIKVYDANRIVLEKTSRQWGETHINANKRVAPQEIQDHIASVIVAIETLRSRAKEGYDRLLTNANYVTTRILQIQEMMAKIKKIENELSNQVFVQNEPPLLEALAEQPLCVSQFLEGVVDTLLDKVDEFRIYHTNYTERFWKLLLFTFLIALYVGYFYTLYRKKKLFIKKESFNKKSYFFIRRPISTTLVLMELVVVSLYPDTPASVRSLELLIILIPIFRILQTVFPKRLLHYFYIYFILYFFSVIEKNSIGFSVENRLYSITLSILLLIFIVTLIRRNVMDFISFNAMRRFIRTLLPLFAGALLISVVANLYGSVQLAERISSGIFHIIHASLIFYSLSVILTGYMVLMLRRRIASASFIMEQFAVKVERTIGFFVKLALFVWWFVVTTKVIGVYDAMVSTKDEILALSWTISNTTISVKSVTDFILIIVVTWILARSVRIILEVEVFSRFKFPRGVPTAISTTLNYLIVISGTIIALSSLGITTEQFTLIFGALGVGIGFGLRNIIANFVSGIIMVFERPIQIGDTIEIDSTMGTVLGIGARSSSIKTFDGSEVIIPNADFIATKVTNWTLSDDRRRKVLLFKVDFDSDIERVLEIMKTIAKGHPNVLQEPEPLAAFEGFGEYYLEFKLYFWLSKNLIVAQSDIAIGVYKALKQEGIKMPLPKQENLLINRESFNP